MIKAKLLMLTVFLFTVSGEIRAGLILTINSYTTDEISLSISGTLDADTVGDLPGYLAIKNDWSNNQGSHTEWFDGYVGMTSVSTVTIDGRAVDWHINPYEYNQTDSLSMYTPWSDGTENPTIYAGTVIVGDITLQSMGAFDPAHASTLELVSGYNFSSSDFVRLEARASVGASVPDPSSFALLALGALACGHTARRRRRRLQKRS